MTSLTLDEQIAYSRQHFEEGLMRAGFVETSAGWKGMIPNEGKAREVLIDLPLRFPFKPPRVQPTDEESVGWSWHRELDGALCLVAEDDHEGLWWADPAAFLEHIAAWFTQAEAGWQDDRPDLDLERYFHASEDTRLFLYGDLSEYCNAFVRFRAARNNTMIMTLGTSPAKVSPRMKDRFGYMVNLGKVDVPPRTWGDIASRIDPSVNLDRRIRQHTISVVVLSYTRADHPGALVVEVWPTTSGTIAVRRLRSSPNTEVARAARAGLLAPAIRNSKVAVVGTGALGSFIADMLVRAGVRHLTLIDGDVVTPGNVVRHVAGEDQIGMPKPDAVREQLGRHDPAWARDIVAVHEPLISGADATEVIAHHDLVVDATADFATTALLHLSAASMGANILSAVILEEGAKCRVDVLPPLDDASLLPPSTSAGQGGPRIYEAGCGSPISATPPYAVVEAAAVATRHVIGVLTGKPVHPSGEIRALLPAVEGVLD